MVDKKKHEINVVKLRDEFLLDIRKYFTKEKCDFYSFDINDFLKEYWYYNEFIIKKEIKIKTNNLYKGYNEFIESYNELIIPFKINDKIIEMSITKHLRR